MNPKTIETDSCKLVFYEFSHGALGSGQHCKVMRLNPDVFYTFH